MRNTRVAIVGGGAAGLSAAIAAARLGADVTVLEGAPRVGRKVLASGNGRCNLTNLSAAPWAYNQPGFVEPVLGRYDCAAIGDVFASMGLLTFADDEGRVYPQTNAASSVLDVLRLECAHLGVSERLGFEAVGIAKKTSDAGFEVLASDGDSAVTDAVVVTTGGGSPLLAATGHDMVETCPVLGPVRTDPEPIRGLSGVRVRCAATLIAGAGADGTGGEPVACERGELLFRDYGVSGIMVFDLSRSLRPGSVISIDFFPDSTLPELTALIAERCAALDWRSARTLFAGMLNDRVAAAVLRAARVDVTAPVDRLPQARIAESLKGFRLEVLGMGDARQAQVTRGGAAVEGFDARTLESRQVAGLFAAGEVLDVDGRSGGYNLHWAWASGLVAGEGAARSAASAVASRDPGSKDST